jgi:hypothetical protein
VALRIAVGSACDLAPGLDDPYGAQKGKTAQDHQGKLAFHEYCNSRATHPAPDFALLRLVRRLKE